MTQPSVASRRPPAPRLLVPLLGALAALPAIYVLTRALLSSRNVAYWDEIDSAVGLLLQLKRSPTWTNLIDALLSVSNEHRTFTSRLLFAVSYWLTGTVNFVAIGVIGNLFICSLCLLLVLTAGRCERRVRMAVLLAAFIFQLEHYENFLWSGSSIDHFQVVLLAGAAFVALARRTRAGLVAAGLLGLLATFTLAHGLVVWPVGALVLLRERRRSALAVWLGIAALAGLEFFHGFDFNPGHHVGDFAITGPAPILLYWLKLLGAPLALGLDPLAPSLGVLLLVLLARGLRRNWLRRERIALPLALWATASLLLVAIGRVNVASGHVYSRYYVLGALAWALVLFMQFEGWREAARPYRIILRSLPLLALFNVTADARFASEASSWVICRDNATDFFVHYGRDGVGTYSLHPDPGYATEVLRQAEESKVFFMPRLCRQCTFPSARPAEDLSYFVDRITVDRQVVNIEGWSAFHGREIKPNQIHVILRSTSSRLIFTTLPVERADVAQAYPHEQWRESGFHFQRRRWLLPPENYQVGLLIDSEQGPEFIMTAHRLDLTGEGQGILAN